VKRGFVIITIFLILIGACIWEDVYLSSNLKKLNTMATELAEVVRQSENANDEIVKNKIKDLDEFWSTTENYFCLVVNHINMEEAGEQLTKIKTLSELNKKEELLIEVDLLIYFSKSYEHIIVPHIQNIL